jgi:hypothetical protein
LLLAPFHAHFLSIFQLRRVPSIDKPKDSIKFSKLSLATAFVFANTSVMAKTSKSSKRGTEDVGLTLTALASQHNSTQTTDSLQQLIWHIAIQFECLFVNPAIKYAKDSYEEAQNRTSADPFINHINHALALNGLFLPSVTDYSKGAGKCFIPLCITE